MEEEQKFAGGRNDEFVGASQYAELSVEGEKAGLYPTEIKKGDITAHVIQPGETEIVAQRHGKYIRERENPNVGSLSAESAEVEHDAAKQYFESFFKNIPEAERNDVEILFVASDTQYFEGGRRSLETGTIAEAAAREVLEQMGLSADQIHNIQGGLKGEGGPRVMPALREPNFVNESPDFFNFLLDKYGKNGELGLDFWVAFEDDKEKVVREAMGAEGPDQIADRMKHSLDVLARYAKYYHAKHPEKRLIIWAATHYDTISPFVKREIFGVDKTQQLLVEYGGGITIDVDKNGNAVTELGGKAYQVPLKK